MNTCVDLPVIGRIFFSIIATDIYFSTSLKIQCKSGLLEKRGNKGPMKTKKEENNRKSSIIEDINGVYYSEQDADLLKLLIKNAL
jgi:hypothetical protein